MYYKLIAIDLSKQQNLNADPKAIQQINFAGNLTGGEGALMFFIIEEAKEKVLEFKLKRVTTPTHPHSPYSPPTSKNIPTHPYPPIKNVPSIKNVHLAPPTQNIPPPTPTHPQLPLKNLYPPPSTKNIPYPIPLTPTNPHPAKICLHPPHSFPITHKNIPKIYLHPTPPSHKMYPCNSIHPKYTILINVLKCSRTVFNTTVPLLPTIKEKRVSI